MPLSLNLGDVRFFVLRQHLRDDLRYLKTSAQRLGRPLIIPGQHNHVNSHFSEQIDRLSAAFLFHIGYRQNSDQPIFLRKQKRRLSLIGKRFDASVHIGERHSPLRQKRLVSRAVRNSFIIGQNAFSKDRLKTCHLWYFYPLLFCVLKHGLRERMLAALLHPRGNPHKRVLIHAGRNYIRNPRLSLCYRPRLIHHNRIHSVRNLKRLPGFDQNPVLGALARSHHNRNRRRKSERARTGNYQHRDPCRQRKLQIRPRHHPDYKRRRRYCHYHRDKNARYFIRKLCNRRFARAGFIYQTDNLADRRITPDALRAEMNVPRFIHSRRDNRIPRLFFYRYALAGNRRFINTCSPLRNDSVGRDTFSRLYDNDIPHNKLRSVDLF